MTTRLLSGGGSGRRGSFPAPAPVIDVGIYLGTVANQAAMLALAGNVADWCIRSDLNTVWVVIALPLSNLASWQQYAYPGMTAHALAGALHTSDTITNLNTKLTDGSLVTSKAAEISAFTNKASPVSADLLVIEDSAAGNAKKNITIGSLPYPFQVAKVTITYTLLLVAALTNSITLFAVPAGAMIVGTRLKVSTPFLGGAIANYFLSIGVAGSTQDLMGEYDSMNLVVGDTEYAEAQCFQSFNYNASVNILVTGRSVGNNLSAATQGACLVEIFYVPKA